MKAKIGKENRGRLVTYSECVSDMVNAHIRGRVADWNVWSRDNG